MPILLAILLSVTLMPPFGEAEARALEIDSGMTVELVVEVQGSWSAVLARAVAGAGELAPVALVDHGDGRWVGVMRLSGREDVNVAFEAIDPDGDSHISAFSTLTELGVDPAVISSTRPTIPPRDDRGPNWWLIGAVGAAVGSLVLIAAWAFWSGIDKRSTNPDNTADVDQFNERIEHGNEG